MWHCDSLYSGRPSVSSVPGESHTCGKVIALSETESGKCGFSAEHQGSGG